jgi:hypothetical protein
LSIIYELVVQITWYESSFERPARRAAEETDHHG